MRITSEGWSRAAPWALFLSALAFAGCWLFLALTAPERLPGHFAFDGTVDRWDGKWTLLGMLGGVGVLLLLLFVGLGAILGRLPAAAINVPDRDYWLQERHRPEFGRRITADLRWIGAATMLLFAWMMIPIAIVGRGGEVGPMAFGPPTAAFLLAVLGYSGWMVFGSRYRRPPEGDDTGGADVGT